jgi:hypothetical protein
MNLRPRPTAAWGLGGRLNAFPPRPQLQLAVLALNVEFFHSRLKSCSG